MKLPKVPKGEGDQGSAPDQTARALLNLRCAVDHCHDAVFIIDPSGNVEFINPAFEVLTGYSAHEAVGNHLGLFVAEGGSSAHKSILREVLEQGIYRGTLDFRHKDGKTIELDLEITALRDYQTQTAKLVCTGRDITQECELQAELSAVRRMETVGALAGGVAHDFNNLLMVISAYAELGLPTCISNIPCGATWRRF